MSDNRYQQYAKRNHELAQKRDVAKIAESILFEQQLEKCGRGEHQWKDHNPKTHVLYLSGMRVGRPLTYCIACETIKKDEDTQAMTAPTTLDESDYIEKLCGNTGALA